MAQAKTKPGFSSYLAALREALETSPSLVVLWGSCDFLMLRGSYALRDKWPFESSAMEAKSLSYDQFEALWQQQDLFSSKTQHTIRRVESFGRLADYLAKVPSKEALQNQLILTSVVKSLPVKLKKECMRLGAHFVPCFEPSPAELPKFLMSLAKKKGLALERDASDLILHSQGADLFKIDNELEKLACIFHDALSPLKSADIKSYIGMSHIEHLFKLEGYLIQGEKAKAQALAISLLRKGEQPIAMVGFLSNMLRKALKVSGLLARGYDTRSISSELRMPYRVVGLYRQFLSVMPKSRLGRALILCQNYDVKLKSSRLSPELILSDLILACSA